MKPAGAYTIRNIPPELWKSAKSAAALEGITLREWILQAMANRLKPKTVVVKARS